MLRLFVIKIVLFYISLERELQIKKTNAKNNKIVNKLQKNIQTKKLHFNFYFIL